MESTFETLPQSKKNIELVSQAYVNTALIFLTVIAVSGLLIAGLILFTLGAGLILFATLSAFSLIFIVLLRNFWKSMATAYIRGEMVIVKYINGAVKITELKQVKVCKSHRFLNISFSNLKFRLDGKQHRILLFGSEFTSLDRLSTLKKAA